MPGLFLLKMVVWCGSRTVKPRPLDLPYRGRAVSDLCVETNNSFWTVSPPLLQYTAAQIAHRKTKAELTLMWNWTRFPRGSHVTRPSDADSALIFQNSANSASKKQLCEPNLMLRHQAGPRVMDPCAAETSPDQAASYTSSGSIRRLMYDHHDLTEWSPPDHKYKEDHYINSPFLSDCIKT